jgi:hypothetical protein
VCWVKVFKNGLSVFVVRIKDNKDIVNMIEIAYVHALFGLLCEASMFCKKVSDKVP